MDKHTHTLFQRVEQQLFLVSKVSAPLLVKEIVLPSPTASSSLLEEVFRGAPLVVDQVSHGWPSVTWRGSSSETLPQDVKDAFALPLAFQL